MRDGRQNKRYVHPPALAEGDGPIGKYRVWTRQFYYEDELAAEYGHELRQGAARPRAVHA